MSSRKSKIPSRQIPIMAVLIVLVFFPVIVFYFTPVPVSSIKYIPMPVAEKTIITPEQEPVGYGLPMRLKIPKINVDATFEYVGLTPNGAVGIPINFSNVAWFNVSPRPGDNGSAVVTGHYGRRNGKGSVFDNLYKLRSGDKLYITDDGGNIITFIVREIRRYDPNADALDVFNSNDGKSHLNLITCEGIWNKILKSYSKRLVVFTDKE